MYGGRVQSGRVVGIDLLEVIFPTLDQLLHVDAIVFSPLFHFQLPLPVDFLFLDITHQLLPLSHYLPKILEYFLL